MSILRSLKANSAGTYRHRSSGFRLVDSNETTKIGSYMLQNYHRLGLK